MPAFVPDKPGAPSQSEPVAPLPAVKNKLRRVNILAAPEFRRNRADGRNIVCWTICRANRDSSSNPHEKRRAQIRSKDRVYFSARSTTTRRAGNCCTPRMCKVPPAPPAARNSEIGRALRQPRRRPALPKSYNSLESHTFRIFRLMRICRGWRRDLTTREETGIIPRRLVSHPTCGPQGECCSNVTEHWWNARLSFLMRRNSVPRNAPFLMSFRAKNACATI